MGTIQYIRGNLYIRHIWVSLYCRIWHFNSDVQLHRFRYGLSLSLSYFPTRAICCTSNLIGHGVSASYRQRERGNLQGDRKRETWHRRTIKIVGTDIARLDNARPYSKGGHLETYLISMFEWAEFPFLIVFFVICVSYCIPSTCFMFFDETK